jgi:hypothetical protein
MTALLWATPAAYARQNQGGAPTDAEIEQVRKNIQLLEQTTPPPGHEAEHRKDIATLRLGLRDKLQAQRNALAAYLDRVRSALPPERVQKIEQEIREKERQIAEAGNALTDSAASAPTTTPTAVATTTTPTAVVGTGASPITNTGGQVVGVPDKSVAALPEGVLQPLGTEDASGLVASGAEAAQNTDQLSPCSAITDTNTKQFSEYEVAICALVKNINNLKTGATSTTSGAALFPTTPGEVNPQVSQSANPRAGISLNNAPLELQQIVAAKLIGREERGKFLVEAEEARTDKQVDGGPSNSGSTSLVVKGGAPSVLGFAVSNGALVQSQSGTTVTFRGNPIGIVKLLNNKTFDESYLEDEKDPTTRFLKKTSFSVSFDTDRGKTPGVFTADKQQVSAYSLRYEFVNERDPRDRKHEKALQRFLAEEGDTLAHAVFDTYTALIMDIGGKDGTPLKGNKFKDPALQAWLEETNNILAAAEPGEVEAKLKSQLDKFPTGDKLTSETRDAVNRFAQNFAGYVKARNKLFDEIAKGKVITFEYTNNREVNAPDLSNFRFIAETGIFGGKADLTANASLTIFNSRPAAGMKRIRDFQFAGQIDKPFKVSGVGNFVFSFAGKYERALENVTALDGTVLPNTKGDIAVGQIKLTVPFLDGIKFPISMTFANRTELVREKEVRGNFGFTFDMDKILAKFKPF